MSFVKKAVKKVFKFVKKIVKSKIFKWVAIAALTFFTAGVAAGGFAAFTGVTGVGSFFTAVGQTIATGAASISSMLGFKGMSAGIAQHGGAAAIQAGLTTTATSATGAALQANAALGTISAQGGTNAAAIAGGALQSGGQTLALSAKGLAAADAAINFGGAVGASGLGGSGTTSLISSGVGSSSGLTTVANGLTTTAASSGISGNVWKGLQVGFAAYAASQGNKQRRPKTFVAGGLSRGGTADVGPQPFFVVGGQETQADPAEGPAPTLAGELARGERTVGPAVSSGTQIAAADGRTSGNFGPAEVPGLPQDVNGSLLAQAGTPPPSGGALVQNFLGEQAPTNITGDTVQSFDERVFSGALGRRRGAV